MQLYFQIIIKLLHYWGILFNWDMQIAFTFGLQVGVMKDVAKFKGQMTMLEKSWNLNHEERAY